MIRLRALLVGAALISGASALASAQPLPQANWSYGNRDRDRDRDHDRDNGRYVYNPGYYGGYYARPYYDHEDRRWKDRDDRRDHDRDWRSRDRGRDRDHDGSRRDNIRIQFDEQGAIAIQHVDCHVLLAEEALQCQRASPGSVQSVISGERCPARRRPGARVADVLNRRHVTCTIRVQRSDNIKFSVRGGSCVVHSV